MTNSIHPTAILEGNITLGSNNAIGPYVVMRGNITLGDRNTIGAGVCMENNVYIGDDTRIFSQAAIGAVGEMGLKGDRFIDEGTVVIGDRVTIRELVCIHSPVYTLETRIGDDVYLMNKSYVAHDSVIGDKSVLSAGVLLGGSVIIEEGVTIGMGATVHQRCHVGAYAMIGMQTPVTLDVLPYATIAGSPARIIGFNRRGAERREPGVEWLDEMEGVFRREIKDDVVSQNPLLLDVIAFLKLHPESLLRIKGETI